MLEVGTGFHPELTGRENIYLNGAILGMKKAEIERKFDEIVAFAEIEKFMDTPVKYYSSGMYVRLAFAVAAHLEPEILLVDEVLAVGDAAFQKKCLGKMGDVAREGKTVLFVTHNIPSVIKLCSRGILLESGKIVVIGDAQSVVYSYLKEGAPLAAERYFVTSQSPQPNAPELVFTGIRVLDHQKNPSAYINISGGLCLEIFYRVNKSVRYVQVGFLLWNSEGTCILTSTDLDGDSATSDRVLDVGEYSARCHIPSYCLRPGRYWIDIASSIVGFRMLDEIRQSIAFEVVDTGSPEMRLSQGRLGAIAPVLNWTTERITLNQSEQT
ncbi:MAG: ABC transporter ATP-binding protein [Chloroflexi bacterium]|nr:ABC transporter ATP-binding protein [Chloroflexota bacterium]